MNRDKRRYQKFQIFRFERLNDFICMRELKTAEKFKTADFVRIKIFLKIFYVLHDSHGN